MNDERKMQEMRSVAIAQAEEEVGSLLPPPAQMVPVEAPTGERSEPGDAGAGTIWAGRPIPVDPEVAAKPTRRVFTAEYKLRILEEVDRAASGDVGGILRREGLYSSHLTSWRKARRAGALRKLSQKRGRKPKQAHPLAKKVEQLERDLSRTREALRKAELIIEVQGKVAGLLGFNLEDGSRS